jgi:hypothetical protein
VGRIAKTPGLNNHKGAVGLGGALRIAGVFEGRLVLQNGRVDE